MPTPIAGNPPVIQRVGPLGASRVATMVTFSAAASSVSVYFTSDVNGQNPVAGWFALTGQDGNALDLSTSFPIAAGLGGQQPLRGGSGPGAGVCYVAGEGVAGAYCFVTVNP